MEFIENVDMFYKWGLSFRNLGESCPNIFSMHFGTPENAQNAFFNVFWLLRKLQNTVNVYFSPKSKIILKPIIMVIEGLKFQNLASRMLSHAHDTILPNIAHCQNHVLLAKCYNLVYEIIKYALNRDPFSLKFSGMIETYDFCFGFL